MLKLLLKALGGVWKYIALGGTVVLAILTFGASQKRKGRKAEKALQERLDNEKASNIRKRVDGVKPVPKRNLKYRDSEGDL